MIRGGGLGRWAFVAALVVAGLSSSGSARADGANDTVYLKGGGVVRGVVMEYDPEGGARVKLADGSVRTIAGGLINRVAMGADRAPPAAAAPSAPAEGPTGQLHVDAPADIEIVGRPNEGYEWAPICQSPCDHTVHLDWEYRVRGPGVRASSPFQLAASDGQRVAVAVDPASSTWFVLGIVGVVGGASVTVVGLYVMLIGSLVQSLPSDGSQTPIQTQSGGIVATGAVITAVGVGLLVGGGVAALSNWSTHVTQVGTKDALPARLPTWRSADVNGFGAGLPVAFETPLWTVRF